MIRVPKFKSHLRVELLSPDAVFLFKEDQHQALQGEFIYSIASLIDGATTSDEIKQCLHGRMTESDVESGLLLLEAEGFLTEAGEDLDPAINSICDFFRLDATTVQRRLKRLRVNVLSFGEVDPKSFQRILKDLEIQTGDPGDFTVALVDDYLHTGLQEFNRHAIQSKHKWMIAKPTGNVAWIGPVFAPPRGACWQCLALRLKDNQRAERFVEANTKKKPSSHSGAGLKTTLHAALNLIANELLKQIVGVPPFDDLITFDSRETKLQRHCVARLDHCPECQSKSPGAKRIALKSRKKIFVSPEVTFEKYEHHISPITGIVGRIVPYGTVENDVIHSYIASHIFLPRLHKEDVFQRGFVQQSGGKGTSAMQAKVSALCEALERYSGVFRGNEPRITATANELGDEAILPNACMNFSEHQYAIREKWNRTHHKHDWVPVRFQSNQKIEWTPIWSLTKQKTRYIPTAYCYYGYPLPADHQFCRADSNGNAAGSSLEEAIVQGFLELVERDAAAIWWFNKIRRPCVDLNHFSLPYVNQLREHYEQEARDFWVLDITADFPIPTFVALSKARRKGNRQFLVGFGAHFDPAVALIRALTEMNQFLPGLSSGNTNGVLQPAERDVSFLLPDPSKAKTRNEDAYSVSANFLKDIHFCVKLAAQNGMETFVLDQTRNDVGLPVAKVIVPGMRQFWMRLGTGRLYDVPVKLGWFKKARSERQLNQDRIVI